MQYIEWKIELRLEMKLSAVNALMYGYINIHLGAVPELQSEVKCKSENVIMPQ